MGGNFKEETDYSKQIKALKRKGVPGAKTVDKVEYLMDKYPHIKAKDIANILDVSTQTVHTARWKVRKDRKEAATAQGVQDNGASNHVNPETVDHEPIHQVEEIPDHLKVEQHVDIWDQPGHYMGYIEPPHEPIEQLHAQPVYVQPVVPPQSLAAPRGVIFEIGASGMDGVTLRSLISVVYGKISDNRQYKIHVKLEED